MTKQDNTLTYWLAFTMAKGLSELQKVQLLVDTYDLAGGDAKRLITYSLEDNCTLGANEQTCLGEAHQLLNEAALLLDKLTQAGIHCLPIGSADYPSRLKPYLGYHRPLMLFARGNLALLHKPSVAIVGSRKATELGLAYTEDMAINAVQDGYVVVSGNAKGIDRTATTVALEQGGGAIYVLAEGLLKNPVGFKETYSYFVDQKVCYLSQFMPSSIWQISNAMRRNKVVYGLAETVYVADIELKGGTAEGATEAIQKFGHNQVQFRKSIDPSILSYFRTIGGLEDNNLPTSGGMEPEEPMKGPSKPAPSPPKPAKSTKPTKPRKQTVISGPTLPFGV